MFTARAPAEIYTLSLHDALPICRRVPHNVMRRSIAQHMVQSVATAPHVTRVFEADMSQVIAARDSAKADFESRGDRKSTRLNSSHGYISYAVFCLKKKERSRRGW